MILERITETREIRDGLRIATRIHYTPQRTEERRETIAPEGVVVETAVSEDGFLELQTQIQTPFRVVTITHTEEDTPGGARVKDDLLVQSTPLGDLVNELGRVIMVLASMPVTPENAAAAFPVFNNQPRFQVYPPAPEEEEDFYGLEDYGDHGEPDEENWFPVEGRVPDDCGDCRICSN